jgi:hypothetical protein
MIHDIRQNFFSRVFLTLLMLITLILLAATSAATTRAQTQRRAAHSTSTAPVQQPLYSEYRGVRIGMTAAEVRTKLGEPLQKADDGDFYAFSDKETAQIAYDASHIVKTISVDYVGGVGAPDYKAIVGSDVEVKPDGAIYKVVRYDALGLWVYYNRTAGAAPTVTITLQKSLDR